MNYKDLGFDDNLTSEPNAPDFQGATNTGYIEGVDASQVLSLGKLQSSDGKWYIDFDNGEVLLPPESVKTGNINYLTRGYKAVVSNTGGGDFIDIQQAIDHVHRNGGGSILIKKGLYVLNTNIKLYTRISLFGEGSGETIIDFNHTSNNISLIGGSAELNLVSAFSEDAYQAVTIANMCIKNSTSDNGSVYVMYTMNFSVENVTFNGNMKGLKMVVCIPSSIRNNMFINGVGSGNIFLDVSGGLVNIDNNVFNNMDGEVGIKLSGGGTSSHITFTNNLIDGVAPEGLLLNTGTNYTISNNHFNDAGDYNIDVVGVSFASINNNLINCNQGDGIRVDDLSGTNSVNIGVIGNSVSYAQTAISIVGGNNCQVVGNNVHSSDVGLYISNTSYRNLYDGNFLYGATTPVTDNGTNSKAGDNIVA